jgi:hypothetical protein
MACWRGCVAMPLLLHEQGVKCSIIDGLQRLYCYCIAILIVWRREKLIEDRCIPADAWDYLKDVTVWTHCQCSSA